MIYGRFGDPVTIVRRAVLADVERLDGRKPDRQDRATLRSGSYVVVRQDDGEERLYHQVFLRADGGSVEITAAINAAELVNDCEFVERVTGRHVVRATSQSLRLDDNTEIRRR